MIGTLSDYDLARALTNMARDNPKLFGSTLHHGPPTLLPGTKTTVRTHYILSDASGNVRLSQLAEVLADQIVFFCIPRSDIKALNNLPEDERVAANNRLYRRARQTFARAQPMTGEGSELLLFALLENILKVPQLMTKMSLKTSENVHVHGADAVHAALEQNGNLALYWGEAKMYEDVGKALTACFDSLEPFLRMDWEVIRRDQWLVMHYLDMADEEVKLRLLRFFDQESEDSVNVEARGACVIGFDLASYPRLPHDLDSVQEAIDASLASWSAKINTRLSAKNLQEIEIEVFLVPVPSAQMFRNTILSTLDIPVPEIKKAKD
ncbi:DUF1837 domain-containing protein [Pseudarthrobacter sp. AG30]|uniref:HamA C-terminal domain-containing protein n=1 Tax=Pseudarthrobacter sp. AG30 TaxID=2249742 RepID=UPI000D6E7412|nr:DUF1837 domain-containing protein [Pseudarthrobacter sp. AG30]RAX14901.1 DUF1837 domain-containing protein [Pseudarthrobacter sp. AG30]